MKKTAKKTAVKKVKKKDSVEAAFDTKKELQGVTKFKIWCIKQNLTQRKIRKDTELSIGTIHSTWYKGNANASVVKLLSLVYKIDETKVKKMIQTFDNSNPIED